MKNTILKSLLAISIITFSASMLSVSCGKTKGGVINIFNDFANNSENENSGGSRPLIPTTNLLISIPSAMEGYVKLNGSTVTVRAPSLSAVGTPVHSSTDDNDRGFLDVISSKSQKLFDIKYPNVKAAIILVSRTHVRKDTITVKAAAPDEKTHCSSSESGDNAIAAAAGGGHCRWYALDIIMNFESHLGTVFDNIKPHSFARASLLSLGKLYYSDGVNANVITDATAFNGIGHAEIKMVMLNSGGGAAAAEIDDLWVLNPASTTEVELYAIGIDVSDKTIEQFSGLKKANFDKEIDKVTFQKMLRNNKWAELKFKVNIVTSANF